MTQLTLGPFAVDRTGTLEPRAAGLRPALRFAWRGRTVEAELGDDAVRIAAIAARVPSSAEAGADRPGAFTALAALPANLPDGWRMRLLPDHRIALESDRHLPSPPTAVSLLAELVRFAMALDPYLDRLEAVGVGAPGTSRT